MEIHSALRFEEVVGKDLFTLFPDLHERKLFSHFERALSGQATVLSTALHRYLLPLPSPFREAGLEHMLQTARIAPLFSDTNVCGIVVFIEDVTQRECQATALARQHRRDELLSWALTHLLQQQEPHRVVRPLFFKIAEYLDFDTFFLYLRDPESGILSLNAAGGVPIELEKDFAHCPFVSLMPEESREMVLLDSVQSRLEPEYALLRKARISAVAALPLLANDRNLGVLCFATWSRQFISPDESDLLITIGQCLATRIDRENTHRQLVKAQEQLTGHAQDLEAKVQERTARLQETISQLETFSYTLAHDLKAPVRGITGYCTILREDFSAKIPAGANHLIQKLAQTSGRMEALVQDLLAFSKVSQQEVILSPVDPEPIIQDLFSMCAPALQHNLSIRRPLHPMRAHRTLLQHVLSNLIDNALKYVEPNSAPNVMIYSQLMPHSSPSTRSRPLLFSSIVSARPDDPATQVGSPQPHVRLWVVDQGVGIPPEIQERIFGIFERGVSSNLYEGTGMGLAIVARAMQRMGGTCGVESEPGKGSRFWIELPAA